jgi:hypothetical protein
MEETEVRLFAPDSLVVQVAAELLLAHIRGPGRRCVICDQPTPCATSAHARLVCRAAGLKGRVPGPPALTDA